DDCICGRWLGGGTDGETLLADSTVVNLDPLMEQGSGAGFNGFAAGGEDVVSALDDSGGHGQPHVHAHAKANANARASARADASANTSANANAHVHADAHAHAHAEGHDHASGIGGAAAADVVGACGFEGCTAGPGQPCPDVGRSGLEARSKREAVGCGCLSGGEGTRRKSPGIFAAPSGQSHAFANGRGSVKLNVLLDSQTFIGTADFMAPEMITGKEKQGTAMDWWALGVILYEITLGTLPFHSEMAQTSTDVFRSIVNAELSFPRRHPLSRSAVDFIRQLLQKNPAERLGERKGVGEIKRHRFLRSVHWALIANSKPPFVLSGPDSPEWAAAMATASPESRDEKMATWTWM
ncbi:unnamed protein product, partial [Laminaria digitata]